MKSPIPRLLSMQKLPFISPWTLNASTTARTSALAASLHPTLVGLGTRTTAGPGGAGYGTSSPEAVASGHCTITAAPGHAHALPRGQGMALQAVPVHFLCHFNPSSAPSVKPWADQAFPKAHSKWNHSAKCINGCKGAPGPHFLSSLVWW